MLQINNDLKMETSIKGLLISTDKNLLDVNYIYGYLSKSYWAMDRTKEKLETSITNSLCFGMYFDGKQIGFARVVTDYVVFAYLMDLYVDDKFQGKGYGSVLMDHILGFPELKHIESWKLATLDAHDFYFKKGFRSLVNPKLIMEKK